MAAGWTYEGRKGGGSGSIGNEERETQGYVKGNRTDGSGSTPVPSEETHRTMPVEDIQQRSWKFLCGEGDETDGTYGTYVPLPAEETEEDLLGNPGKRGRIPLRDTSVFSPSDVPSSVFRTERPSPRVSWVSSPPHVIVDVQGRRESKEGGQLRPWQRTNGCPTPIHRGGPT